ncbi:MAG: S8 family peptidase [Solirubrobacteraceae bacterium]
MPFLAALLLVLALAGGSAPAAAPQLAAPAVAGAVSNDLAAVAASSPGRTVETIVQLQAGAAQDLVRARIAATGGVVFDEVPLINGLGVRMRASDAVALADLAGVRAVSLNAKVESTGAVLDASRLSSAYIQAIRADKAWANGHTGKGVGIAVIDSGLAGGLPDFKGADGKSRGVVSAVVNPRTGDAKDTFGHGTHIAGLAAGNGFNRATGDPLYGKYAGVAPDANVIAVKADNGSGATDVISLIDGLHFVVTHAKQYNIRVVNLSVRTEAANSYRTDPLDAAVEAVWMHGIVVVAAAGNLGESADAVSHAPGNDPYVITVGAVDDHGTKGISDDELAIWSGHGTTQDGFAKPDVLAPGAHLVAPLAPGSYYASACAACVVDGQYIRLGGTSMATGVVSGAIAAIVQAHPEWTPNQIKATLLRRSREVNSDDGAVGREIALDKVLYSNNGRAEAPANQGLTPSNLIDPATGTINATDESWAASSWGASSWGASSWGASSWGASSWGAAGLQQYVADWAGASYTGVGLDPTTFDAGNPQNCWQLARTAASSWGASSWGASSWGSADLDAAKTGCDAASKAAAEGQASSWGASSWGASSWGASSWGASSWGASSWGASSWGASSWGASSWGASSWGATSWATAWDK